MFQLFVLLILIYCPWNGLCGSRAVAGNEMQGDHFEGDIALRERLPDGSHGARLAALRDSSKRWPGGRVPYRIDTISIPNAEHHQIIRDAMDQISRKVTCVNFVDMEKLAKPKRDFIRIAADGDDNNSALGCWSYLGMIGGEQTLNLDGNCFRVDVIVHELLHALSFIHEQNRSDRDDFVEIRKEHIKPGMEFQFIKRNESEVDEQNTPYDFKSRLHYPPTAFSRSGEDTIMALYPGNDNFGPMDDGLSPIDVVEVSLLYDCEVKNSAIIEYIHQNRLANEMRIEILDDNQFEDFNDVKEQINETNKELDLIKSELAICASKLEENAEIKVEHLQVINRNSDEINQMKLKYSEDTHKIESKHAEDVNNIKLEILSEIKLQHSNDINNLQLKHSQEINNIKSEIFSDRASNLPLPVGEYFGACVNNWCRQLGTFDQFTRCEAVRDQGHTCIHPQIKYGATEGGIPSKSNDDNYDAWCQQILGSGKTLMVNTAVTYGARSCAAPQGKLLWGAGGDETAAKWKDSLDGMWKDSSLDEHTGCETEAITSLTCEKETFFGACVHKWCHQTGTSDQFTRCESIIDDGLTCVNPEIRYGSTVGGIPSKSSYNKFDEWCKQVLGFGTNSRVTYGTRDCAAPKGRLFWYDGGDEPTWKWCNWNPPYKWKDGTLSYHVGCQTDAITSLTCGK